ncbi:hypothetical protein EYF80_009498 [Liparis tanakae]|uniref:Uncharacterized protein n=1 Tax=Liparis tanakae TaxID=230148 RepID=A0A4Z2ISL4_9TELE|nr:hypothetical protein EYF80_009498 [Liparis tanakae]
MRVSVLKGGTLFASPVCEGCEKCERVLFQDRIDLNTAPKLVTNCTFVGRGLCQAGAGGDCPRVQALETLSVSKWGLLYFTL